MTWELVRLKAYHLELLLITHHMVLRLKAYLRPKYENDLTHPNTLLIFFKLFCTQNGIFYVFAYWWPKFWGSKNRFFSIFLKCHVKHSYWWIWPKNVFWRPWKPVSDNFQVAIVILSPFVKIQNFQKNAIFAIFWIFWCWSFWVQKSIKIVKNMKIFKNRLFTSQRYSQIPRMTFHDRYIEFYANLKITRKYKFPLKRAEILQMWENAIFR